MRPVNLGTPPKLRQGRVLKNSWPNMRRKGVLRDRRGHQAKSRIRDHRQDIKSNRVKVIILHLVDRLLHGIVGILTFIHLWIIVGCICNHIIFNILLCIQIMHYYKDRLLLAIIRSSKMLIAAKRMGRARSKIQSIYSRGGVPQVCLILRSEGCNVCARRRQWDNKWRPCQRRQRQ